MDRYYPHMEVTRKACRILIGKTEEKRPLGRSNSRMQDNTKMDFNRYEMSLLLKVVISISIYFLGSKTFKCLQHPVNLRLKRHILLLCVHKLYTVV